MSVSGDVTHLRSGWMVGGEGIMYKKQLSFQKFACLFAIIAVALCFVYSLGLITDIFETLYYAMVTIGGQTVEYVSGASIYFEFDDFVRQFVNYSVILILVALLLFLTNTQVRRRYYIGNYVAIGLYSVSTVAVNIWAHTQITQLKSKYLATVDFEQLKVELEMLKKTYTDSTFWLDVHYLINVVCILAVVALLVSMIWKIVLMRAEKALIQAGKEALV